MNMTFKVCKNTVMEKPYLPVLPLHGTAYIDRSRYQKGRKKPESDPGYRSPQKGSIMADVNL